MSILRTRRRFAFPALPRAWSDRLTSAGAWLVLAVCATLSVAAWQSVDDRARREAQAEFHARVADLVLRLERRLTAYEQVLRGAAGLQAAVGQPLTRAQWQAYVRALNLEHTLPGVEALGFLRATGGDEPGFSAAALVVPQDVGRETSARPDGLADPMRLTGMSRSRDSGRPSLTGKLALAGTDRPSEGFAMLVPIYDGPVETIAQRRSSLLGWAYGELRLGEFVRGLAPEADADLAIWLYDSPQPRADALIHANATAGSAIRSGFEAIVPLQVADRVWSLQVASTPAFERRLRTGDPRSVLVAGLLASLLVFVIVWAMGTTRRRALDLARHMTEALRFANDRLEEKVRERTASLADTNQRLERENAQRERAELERSRALARERELNLRLRAAADAFTRFNVAADVDDKLEAIASEVRSMLGCRFAAAALEEPAGLRLRCAAATDEGAQAKAWCDAVASSKAVRQAPARWRRVEDPELASLGVTDLLSARFSGERGEGRGWIAVSGRGADVFENEDALVIAQLALLAGSALSQHELLRREQQARADAEAANRAKDEMLAVVSHELRTPLNAIQGWLHILRRKRPLDEATVARAVDVLQRNLDTQIQVVDDLLDTARIASGKMRLQRQSVQLEEIVRATIETVRAAAANRRVRLEVRSPASPVVLEADPHRIKQVLWNLLNNAVKFTPAGGTVTVAARSDERQAVLEVRDTGQGIAPDFLPHVFERFKQAGFAATRQVGGLGLGLALVRHIVDAHGGTVEAASDGPGRGACFTVRLPLDGVGATGAAIADHDLQDAARVADEAHFEPPRLEGLWVLFVEDHVDSRELWSQAVRDWGAQVLEAGDIGQALQCYASIPHAARRVCVLCDLGLPGASGFDVLAALREKCANGGGPEFVAIAVSAFARREDVEAARSAGFHAHVAKPVSAVSLAAALRAACDG